MVWEADIWNTSFVTKTACIGSLHLCSFVLHTHTPSSVLPSCSLWEKCVFFAQVYFSSKMRTSLLCVHTGWFFCPFLPEYKPQVSVSTCECIFGAEAHACRGDLVHSACTQFCTLLHCIAYTCTELNCIALLHCIALMHLGIWWKLFDRQLAGGMQHVSMHLCCFVNSFFCLFVLYFGISLMWQARKSILYLVNSIFYLVCFVFWSVRNNL